MDIPTYTEDTQKEKFEKGLINVWPKVYRFINGFVYFILNTAKDGVIRAIGQIFHP